ncbi:MAG TPA: hypothetical protein VLJ68_05255 [Chitinophagaceae bacterium]|nr:hypothetical protein [Chitinophagaceae bacterium]
MLKKFLDKLNGLHFQQEYLCLAKETMENPLHVYISVQGKALQDITETHVFAGYNPLVFILPSNDKIPTDPFPATQVIFSQNPLTLNEVYREKDAVAKLDMKWVKRLETGHFVYEGMKGQHHFLSKWHQFVIGFENRLFNNKPGNIFLRGNLLQQIQIAYSVPRVISLVTLGSGDKFNVFPTDLNGELDNDHYVISLRKNGKACQQAEMYKKFTLSQVQSKAYKMVYALGKNHMQEPRPKEDWIQSKIFSLFPYPDLPVDTLRYRELEILNFSDLGIHRIFLCKTGPVATLDATRDTLSHIHTAYASWRFNKGLGGNYLLR